MSKLIAREYEILDENRPADMVVKIKWRGEGAWCVWLDGDVLSHKGGWEIEPTPSSRTAEFKRNTRWPTVSAAHQAYERFCNA